MIKFNQMKKVIFFGIAALLCNACASRINGSLYSDGRADLGVSVALEPRMAALIGGLSAASGTNQPGGGGTPTPVLDGASIGDSMSAAPGIASASFRNNTPSAIEGTVKITNVGNFLSDSRRQGAQSGAKNLDFIHFEQASSGGTASGSAAGGRCTVSLNRDSGPEILDLLSPEITEYLSALMAPLATGEKLTKPEYLDLVGSVYGKGIADEISKASIRASIDFPGQVQSAQGGTFSGRKAEFNIPLPDILVLETPLSYEVVWK
jgi:hypothetical protein